MAIYETEEYRTAAETVESYICDWCGQTCDEHHQMVLNPSVNIVDDSGALIHVDYATPGNTTVDTASAMSVDGDDHLDLCGRCKATIFD